MWQRTQELTVVGITKDEIWAAWSDVDRWHLWDGDIEYATLPGHFRAGGSFLLKPKGGPRVRIRLVRADANAGYTDLTTFPLARMYGIHDMVETPNGVRLTVTIRVEGPLAWLWTKLVAQKIADESATQLASLAAYVRRTNVLAEQTVVV